MQRGFMVMQRTFIALQRIYITMQTVFMTTHSIYIAMQAGCMAMQSIYITMQTVFITTQFIYIAMQTSFMAMQTCCITMQDGYIPMQARCMTMKTIFSVMKMGFRVENLGSLSLSTHFGPKSVISRRFDSKPPKNIAPHPPLTAPPAPALPVGAWERVENKTKRAADSIPPIYDPDMRPRYATRRLSWKPKLPTHFPSET